MQQTTISQDTELPAPKRIVFLDLELVDPSRPDSIDTLNAFLEEDPSTQLVLHYSPNSRFSTTEAAITFLTENEIAIPLHNQAFTVFSGGAGISSWLDANGYSGSWVSFDRPSSRYTFEQSHRAVVISDNDFLSYENGAKALDILEADTTLPPISAILVLREDIQNLILEQAEDEVVRDAIRYIPLSERESLLLDIIEKGASGDLIGLSSEDVVRVGSALLTTLPFVQQVSKINALIKALTISTETPSILEQMAEFPDGTSLENNSVLDRYRVLSGILSEASGIDGLGRTAPTTIKPLLQLVTAASSKEVRQLVIAQVRPWLQVPGMRAIDNAMIRETISSANTRYTGGH